MKRVEIRIPDMSCQHCVGAVTSALESVPGVSEVQVDLDAKRATVDANPPAEVEALTAAVEAAGYSAWID